MRPIINSTKHIGACGLYCGSCRKYRKLKCPGCRYNEDSTCRIRQCCSNQDIDTCADCPNNVENCDTYNDKISKLFSLLFNSDRTACIRYIREHGEKSFADKMTEDQRMTMPRRKPLFKR